MQSPSMSQEVAANETEQAMPSPRDVSSRVEDGLVMTIKMIRFQEQDIGSARALSQQEQAVLEGPGRASIVVVDIGALRILH